MPRKGSGRPPSTSKSGSPAKRGLGVSGNFTVAEGQRFKADLDTVAYNPRNLREEWEFSDDSSEWTDFQNNLEKVGGVQDPAVCSVAKYVAKYPAYRDHFEDHVAWVLLAGERRVRAAHARGDSEIPAVLRNDLLEKGDLALLSENNYRKNFDPIQEGILFKRMAVEDGYTYAQIADELGATGGRGKVKNSDISKRVRLAELPDGEVRRAIRTGELKPNPAYLLVSKLKEIDKITEAYGLMQSEGLSAEAAVARLAPPADPPARPGAPAKPLPNSAAPTGPGASGKAKPELQGEQQRSLPRQSAGGDAASPLDQRHLLRVEACRRIVANRTYSSPSEVTQRLAAAVVQSSSVSARDLAASLLGLEAETGEGASVLLAQIAESDDAVWVIRAADVIALASDEIHVRALQDSRGVLDVRARAHLQMLQEVGGYIPADDEAIKAAAQAAAS